MIREELWDFPHSMQLKVMGAADAPLEEAVVEILETHLDDFDRHAHLSSKPSTKGNFVSLTATVLATTQVLLYILLVPRESSETALNLSFREALKAVCLNLMGFSLAYIYWAIEY